MFGVGVCVAIPPVGPTPVLSGVPKTGFMMESHGHGDGAKHRRSPQGRPATEKPTWNAVCLADFGDGGVAFVAAAAIPPRNVNWSSKGNWVHYAKIAFEKYFIGKIRRGESEPFYERWIMEKLQLRKIKETV